MRLHHILLTAVALTALPGIAQAEIKSAAVTASVREVCRLDAPTLSLDLDTPRATGMAFEACNSGRSYEIAVLTRNLAADEDVAMQYGAEHHPLDPSGSTLIARRNGPMLMQIPLVLEARSLRSPLTLTFAVSAI